jgi:hypothetical protein
VGGRVSAGCGFPSSGAQTCPIALCLEGELINNCAESVFLFASQHCCELDLDIRRFSDVDIDEYRPERILLGAIPRSTFSGPIQPHNQRPFSVECFERCLFSEHE